MNFTANELNQYAARCVPDLFSVFEEWTVETATGGTWTQQTATAFRYDRFNLVGEDIGGPGSTPAETNYFVWGPDLSGAPVFNEFSANVNVGQTVSSYGSLAAASHFGFSTKYGDGDLGLYYYGFRYYSPGIGRWMNRDPIGELGGWCLYNAFLNNPVNNLDPNGESIVQGVALVVLVTAFSAGVVKVGIEMQKLAKRSAVKKFMNEHYNETGKCKGFVSRSTIATIKQGPFDIITQGYSLSTANLEIFWWVDESQLHVRIWAVAEVENKKASKTVKERKLVDQWDTGVPSGWCCP